MTVSLRWRVLVLVFVINALVFGAGGAFLVRVQVAENERAAKERTEDLLYTLKGTIRPDAELNVAYILQWPYWNTVEDAILVDRELYEHEQGGIRIPGIALNPVGALRRPPGFREQSALRAILRSVQTGGTVEEVQGGRAVPIHGPRGIWGGLWYRTEVRVDRLAIVSRMLPWFGLSTLLLTLGTFFTLRKLVLDPVEQLAGGADRVRGGDFSVRLAVPRRRDELSGLVRSFNEMTETVQGFNARLEREVEEATEKARQAEAAAMTQRRLAAMGELAAGIAHEINNPLGGLQNAVHVLGREDLAPEKRSKYLELLRTGLERIGETVRRLRRFTPRESADETFDLVAAIDDAVQLVMHRARRGGVEIVTELPAGGVQLRGVRNDVGQALLNLLTNSLDALEERGSNDPQGPRILVALQRTTAHVTITVRDNGPGVDAEQLKHVPDLFYTTKEVGKGTGLGLSLVHSAVHRHDGEVRIRSERGRWFAVELILPSSRIVGGEPSS